MFCKSLVFMVLSKHGQTAQTTLHLPLQLLNFTNKVVSHIQTPNSFNTIDYLTLLPTPFQQQLYSSSFSIQISSLYIGKWYYFSLRDKVRAFKVVSTYVIIILKSYLILERKLVVLWAPGAHRPTSFHVMSFHNLV